MVSDSAVAKAACSVVSSVASLAGSLDKLSGETISVKSG